MAKYIISVEDKCIGCGTCEVCCSNFEKLRGSRGTINSASTIGEIAQMNGDFESAAKRIRYKDQLLPSVE